MKIKEVLVNLLVKMTPEVYEKYNFYKNREKVLYVKVLWALYGMLGKYLLWQKKLRIYLKEIGYEFNPYDPCVAKQTMNYKQQSIRCSIPCSFDITRVSSLVVTHLTAQVRVAPDKPGTN